VTHDFSATSPLHVPDLLNPTLVEATIISAGHIHQTWRVVDGDGREYAVQALNERVFPDFDALNANSTRVSRRLRETGVPTIESVGVGPERGMVHLWDGYAWRASRWVHGRRPDPTDPVDVRNASMAFGRLDGALLGLNDLHEVIANFHDPTLRYQQMLRSVVAAPLDRISAASIILDRIREAWPVVAPAVEARSGLPTRVAHNDAKIDNVIAADDGRMVVIDLDTVMPGTILNDVGEMLRSVVRPIEDEMSTDVAPLEMVEAVMSGFTEGFGELAPPEAELMPWAGVVLTIENAMRFLTDFADGDIYFSVDDPFQNLRRAKVQVDLAEKLLRMQDQIAAVVISVIRG